MGEMIKSGNVGLWVERRGQGPDVLLIAGLGDPAEAWEPQLEGLADRWRLTAFDNRGAGRTPLPPADEPFTVATMADDAAGLLRALEVPAAQVTFEIEPLGPVVKLTVIHDGLTPEAPCWRWSAEVGRGCCRTSRPCWRPAASSPPAQTPHARRSIRNRDRVVAASPRIASTRRLPQKGA